MSDETTRNATTAVDDGSQAPPLEQRKAEVALVIHHRDGAKVVPLRQGAPVVVGRAWPADAVVRDVNVSRQHARFTWDEQAVWVEDLGSTNGTRHNGVKVERAQLRAGDEVTLGSATVSLHVLSPRDEALHSVEGHDRFLGRLEEELVRARTFGRPLALVMVRAVAGERRAVRHWSPGLKRVLRPVDSVGLYGPEALLVALPETTADAAIAAARSMIAASAPAEARLVCGVASFPAHASSAEELVDLVRGAARSTGPDEPVAIAGPLEGGVQASALPTIVRSPSMIRLFETVERLARSPTPVLIVGETGTGKELVARALHDRGPRGRGPMRTVNCGAIPATLVESILFGHERGAFTGADRAAAGIFEQASRGTVLLDEVGELSLAAQAAFLRVLETRQVSRVGSDHDVAVDVRVVGATHRDLEAMCNAGTFRWDLYYRLAAVCLEVPPLRERPEELEPLCDLFLGEARRATGSKVSRIDRAALEALRSYAWPGNVRELRNVIERAAIVAEGDAITLEDLSARVRGDPAGTGAPHGAVDPRGEPDVDFKERVRHYETDLILDALRRAGGNQTEAAKLLRMPLRTLVHKIRTYGIRKHFGT